jgi:hypothetical protein
MSDFIKQLHYEIDAQKTIYFLFTEQEDRLNSTSSIQPIRDKISLQFSSTVLILHKWAICRGILVVTGTWVLS